MDRKRKIKDTMLNGLTYLASSVSVIVLVLVFGFILQKGLKTLSLEMLTNDYWSKNVLVDVNSQCGSFTSPSSVDGYFSECYGVVFQDKLSHEKKNLVIITHIDENSPFAHATIKTAGPNFGKPASIALGDQIERLETDSGSLGMILNQNAETIIEKMDQSTIQSLYFKTPGGGIWGSLKATLMLIALTLLFALPIGIGAAIYLEEIAQDSVINRLIASFIEMLAGIPSIIFGLMGVVVLFPITSLFGVDGVSVLLGAFTMAIMLLPVIIRSVQEALLVVPKAYRLSSLSLGANETQTIFKVVLPSALPGIIASVLLSMSRVIGESAALIYTMGTFINDSPNINQGATTLSVHIWSIMGSEQPNFELAAAISIVILAMVLVLNVLLKVISSRYRRKLGLE